MAISNLRISQYSSFIADVTSINSPVEIPGARRNLNDDPVT
jgi:hypothetical protein